MEYEKYKICFFVAAKIVPSPEKSYKSYEKVTNEKVASNSFFVRKSYKSLPYFSNAKVMNFFYFHTKAMICNFFELKHSLTF